MKTLKDKEIIVKNKINNKILLHKFNYVDVKEAVLKFEYILKEFKNISKIENYEGGINEFKNDLISMFIEKHKKIFGNFKK